MSGVSREWPDWFDLLASQITTHYNRGLRESISESTTHQNLKQKTTPRAAPQNRKPSCSSHCLTKNWTTEDGKNVIYQLSDKSWFLLWHPDDMVWIWYKEHESMDPSFLLPTVQADGGVMVWGDIFLAPSGPLSTNWALFKHHNWIYVESISVRIKPVLKAKPNNVSGSSRDLSVFPQSWQWRRNFKVKDFQWV